MRFRILLILIVFLAACSEKKGPDPVYLRVSYTINFPGDTVENKQQGLKWALSYLGATLPDSSFQKHCRPETDRVLYVCFDSLGFSPEAVKVLAQLSDSLKHTEEYQKKNSIDIGEFIALTIGTSAHYYAITGVSPTLKDFEQKYFSGEERVFPVLASSVSRHARLLRIHTDSLALKTAFMAVEGSGTITDSAFKPELYEVFDFMPNGQLRVALYDKDGSLTAGNPPQSGDVGKPAKCLWCHELYIQPLFRHTPDVAGYMTETEFTELVRQQMEVINAYRKQLKGGVDFEKTQEHTKMELLYIAYMEPSLQKLSQEWNMPVETLQQLVKNKTAHRYPEFPFLGDLYHRRELDSVSPYVQNGLPASVRELIGKEPDYLHKTGSRFQMIH